MLPIAPEFVEMLRKVPESQRVGKVLKWKHTITPTKKVIAQIGKKANIKVNATKFASAHDYRRSFGTRWAPKLTPADLKQLMHHAAI
jgi:integrase